MCILRKMKQTAALVLVGTQDCLKCPGCEMCVLGSAQLGETTVMGPNWTVRSGTNQPAG